MNTRRVASIVIAIIVAMLIISAGKSCSKDIAESNKKAATSATTPTSDGMNGFDSLTYPTYQQQTPPSSEATSEENIQYVTNILGEIVGTLPAEEATAPAEPVTTGVSILDRQDPTEETVPPMPTEAPAAPTEATTDSKHPLLGNTPEPEEYVTEPTTILLPSEIVIQIG